MPVWFVLGVQSSARFIVVNCCGVDLLNATHCDVGVTMECWVVGGAELMACCCHRNAPMTIMMRSMGMPMLSQRRVREFIGFLRLVLTGRLRRQKIKKKIFGDPLLHPPDARPRTPAKNFVLCTPAFYHCVFEP